MDGIILVEYETVQSFQTSWIEEGVGSIFCSFASWKHEDGLWKKAWPTSITFASSTCSCIIVPSMTKQEGILLWQRSHQDIFSWDIGSLVWVGRFKDKCVCLKYLNYECKGVFFVLTCAIVSHLIIRHHYKQYGHWDWEKKEWIYLIGETSDTFPV